MIVYEILICVLAGLGAGVGTGFAGLSAAAVISPMLITFLSVSPYHAVGVALASDVLASAASAIAYGKNKNIDIKNGMIMMIFVILFTVVGSWLASLVPETTMSSASLVFMFGLGVRFLVKPITKAEINPYVSKQKRRLHSAFCGMLVGFVCGFIGVGGGMMMLFILTSVLGYELKMAVGTSVFIMTFSALTGAVSHFMIGGIHNWLYIIVCVISTLFFAIVSAKIANKAKPKTLNRTVGVVLIVLGLAMVIFEVVKNFV